MTLRKLILIGTVCANAAWSQTVSQPALQPGDTWTYFTDDHPANKGHSSESRHLTYRVVGWEDIEVPAGKFRALKIEVDRSWTGRIAPRNVSSVATQSGAQGSTAVVQSRMSPPKPSPAGFIRRTGTCRRSGAM